MDISKGLCKPTVILINVTAIIPCIILCSVMWCMLRFYNILLVGKRWNVLEKARLNRNVNGRQPDIADKISKATIFPYQPHFSPTKSISFKGWLLFLGVSSNCPVNFNNCSWYPGILWAFFPENTLYHEKTVSCSRYAKAKCFWHFYK